MTNVASSFCRLRLCLVCNTLQKGKRMRDNELMTMALGLAAPWFVDKCEFIPDSRGLDIYINFTQGATFPCPTCGSLDCHVYDTQMREWRHLDFFQHFCHLHARTPRIKCDQCGVKTVHVPWARPGSGFTLLLEAFIMTMAPNMAVNDICEMIGVWDTRLWRIIEHWVEDALVEQDLSQVKRIGIDETASKRGHNYITVVVDQDTRAAIFVDEGKDHTTIERFVEHLESHGGQAANIKEVTCDMSKSYMRGVKENFPNAEITFDKFHAVKIVNEAVDKVRRQEQTERPELKGTRYVWIKNQENLSEKQMSLLEQFRVSNANLKTARAMNIRIGFQELFDQDPESAATYLDQWLSWASRSRLAPMVKAAQTIRSHMMGILRWFKSGITNAILEGFNSMIQMAKSRARGYRSIKNLKTMVYLVAGKLDLNSLYPQ